MCQNIKEVFQIKIQYISDLHLEFKDNKDGLRHMDTDADVLVIAGDLDIGSKIFDHLIHLSKKRKVIFVYGNHEFYDGKPTHQLKKRGNIVSKFNKDLHILDRQSVIIEDTTFIGATGWIDGSYRDIDIVQFNSYNDFETIYGFASSHNVWGKKDKDFICHTLTNSKTKNNIIITHFLPIPWCISNGYIGSYYNPCFTNNWKWVYNHSDKINYWIHGHSHEFFKMKAKETVFCRNPFGYPREDVDFKPNEFINI